MPVSWDEMMENFSPAERAEINRGADAIVAKSRTLAELRKGSDLTQKKLAQLLSTSQANISEIESKQDALVSTISRMVKGAVGGKLLICVEMPDGSLVRLRMPAKKKRAAQKEDAPKLTGRALAKAPRRAGSSGRRDLASQKRA